MIHEKATALLESLVKTRALVDGNKRLGWVGMRLFSACNGCTITASEDDKFQLVTGELDAVAKSAHRLAGMARSASRRPATTSS